MLPNYSDLNDALEDATSDFQPAEAHGLLCGIICATPDERNADWGKILTNQQANPDALELLQQLYTSSTQQLGEFSFEFNLLLPDDDVDLNQRTESLGLWCQGFLTGLQQGDKNKPLSEDAQDALKDITEIAQVNFGDIPSTDEDESAYADLVEYVRLAVLMIYHEYKAGMQTHLENNNLLH